nr:transposase [Streptomyces marianii]
MINDQAAGPGGKVVADTPRDSPYVLDALYDRDGGERPETIVTDTASYSGVVFGLLTLAGFAYAPQRTVCRTRRCGTSTAGVGLFRRSRLAAAGGVRRAAPRRMPGR